MACARSACLNARPPALHDVERNSSVPSRVGRAVLQRPGRRAVAAAGGGDLAAADLSVPLSTARKACATRSVDPEDVFAALEQLDAAHKASPLVQRGSFPAALAGTWRLVFAYPPPPLFKSWAYIPVKEDAVIDIEKGSIDLVSWVGPVQTSFRGRARFEADEAAGRFQMIFSFLGVEVEAFGRELLNKPFEKPKEKTYTYFLLQDDVAAANSSGTGGKTLMCRESVVRR